MKRSRLPKLMLIGGAEDREGEAAGAGTAGAHAVHDADVVKTSQLAAHIGTG